MVIICIPMYVFRALSTEVLCQQIHGCVVFFSAVQITLHRWGCWEVYIKQCSGFCYFIVILLFFVSSLSVMTRSKTFAFHVGHTVRWLVMPSTALEWGKFPLHSVLATDYFECLHLSWAAVFIQHFGIIFQIRKAEALEHLRQRPRPCIKTELTKKVE